MPTYFITAIDTDAGKTFATGLLAANLHKQGKSVITMKIAQTGCFDISDDIKKHRDLMGIDILKEDKDGITCPYIFDFPSSPHLSAKMEGEIIDPLYIEKYIHKLEKKFDYVLIEGVGGVMVPLNEQVLVIDFMKQIDVPVILVSSARLGSINHTLLSLEIIKMRDLSLHSIIYNHYPKTEPEITQNSKYFIYNYMKKLFPNATFSEIPVISKHDSINKMMSQLDIITN